MEKTATTLADTFLREWGPGLLNDEAWIITGDGKSHVGVLYGDYRNPTSGSILRAIHQMENDGKWYAWCGKTVNNATGASYYSQEDLTADTLCSNCRSLWNRTF